VMKWRAKCSNRPEKSCDTDANSNAVNDYNPQQKLEKSDDTQP